jgi:hypothetical protein
LNTWFKNQITTHPKELYTLKKLERILFSGNPIDPKEIQALIEKISAG